MIARLFTESDYADAVSWWKHHGWEPVRTEHLPKTGFIIEDDTTKYCAGWIYLLSDKLAMIEFIVANPDTGLKSKYKALVMLVKTLLNAAKAAGFNSVFSTLKNRGLEKIYKKSGFVVTDTNVTHYIASI